MDHHQINQHPVAPWMRSVRRLMGQFMGTSGCGMTLGPVSACSHPEHCVHHVRWGHTYGAAHGAAERGVRALLRRWGVGLTRGAGKNRRWRKTTVVSSKYAYTTDLPTLKNKRRERCRWGAGRRQSPGLLSQRGTEALGRGSAGKHGG